MTSPAGSYIVDITTTDAGGATVATYSYGVANNLSEIDATGDTTYTPVLDTDTDDQPTLSWATETPSAISAEETDSGALDRISDDPGTVSAPLACFTAGTWLLTSRGEVAVEALRVLADDREIDATTSGRLWQFTLPAGRVRYACARAAPCRPRRWRRRTTGAASAWRSRGSGSTNATAGRESFGDHAGRRAGCTPQRATQPRFGGVGR